MKKIKFVLPVFVLTLVGCKVNASLEISEDSLDDSIGESISNEYDSFDSDTSLESANLETTSIFKAREIALNQTSTAMFQVEGTITSIIGRSYHIQDGDDAIYVYHGTSNAKFPENFAVGKMIQVTGIPKNYNGLLQMTSGGINNPIKEVVLGAGKRVLPLNILDLDEYTANNISSRLVTIEGLLYCSGNHVVDISSRDKIIFKLGNKDIFCYVDKTIENTLETEIKNKLLGFIPEVTTVFYNGVVGWDTTRGGMNMMPSDANCFIQEM